MSGALQQEGGDGPVARCVRCGAQAVGPCARCRSPVCGDCCVLTDGGAKVWAICLACEDRGGRSLKTAWRGLLGFLAIPVLVLAALVALLAWYSSR